MLRSMFAAVSGLRSHQTMMDVAGNNVSNVNTAGFKASRATFQETLTQVVRGGSGGTAQEQGGVNPMQFGLGTNVSATDLVFTQGATQLTNRTTDLSIQGEGFFVVQVGGEDRYMRAGAFSFDSAGNLTGPNGELVRGWVAADPAVGNDTDTPLVADPDNPPALAEVNVDLASFSGIAIGADGTVTGRNAAGDTRIIAHIAMARFTNNGGLENLGGGLYAPSLNAGDPIVGVASAPGFGSMQSGTLEMSNVDLAQEFTNLILAQRGFQANARTITASDELLQELVNIKR